MSEDDRFGVHAVSKNLFVGDQGVSRAASSFVSFEVNFVVLLQGVCFEGNANSTALFSIVALCALVDMLVCVAVAKRNAARRLCVGSHCGMFILFFSAFSLSPFSSL